MKEMIVQAKKADAAAIAGLAVQMWTSHTTEALTDEFSQLLENENAAVFLCCVDEIVVGFTQCQLRSDYVEGAETSPVGYLEGIFVAEGYRMRGYARKLLIACEQWAKEHGCREFASDCELENRQSILFHSHCGFDEANRIVCFHKKLSSGNRFS